MGQNLFLSLAFFHIRYESNVFEKILNRCDLASESEFDPPIQKRWKLLLQQFKPNWPTPSVQRLNFAYDLNQKKTKQTQAKLEQSEANQKQSIDAGVSKIFYFFARDSFS